MTKTTGIRPPIVQNQAQFERYTSLTASPGTSKNYSHCLQTFLDYFPEKRDASDFSKADVIDYRAYRRKKGVSARTVNYELGVVGRFFRWMMDMETASYNPAQGIKTLKEADVERKSFGEEDQERMYSVCLDDRERLLVGLALTTGLRATTLAQLEKADFNFETNEISIGPEKMKSRRTHSLPIRDREMNLLRDLPDGSIWGSWGCTPRNLNYRWNKICRRAQVKLRGLGRSARRTAATTLIRQGADIRIVQQWLGHKNISQTQKYLTPAGIPELRQALNKMPGESIGRSIAGEPQRSGAETEHEHS